jgi:DNA-directed RNA polymerase subunit RPC12/RpoP
MKCGAEFEKLAMRPSDKADAVCPVCKGRELEEKVSNFASVPKAGSDARCAPAGG